MDEAQLLEMIRKIYEELNRDRERAVYLLKARKIRPLRERFIDYFLWAQAIDKAGFPITVTLMSNLLGVPGHTSVLAELHLMGDKHILTLRRETVRSAHELTEHLENVRTTTPLVWTFNRELFGNEVKLELNS